MATQQWTTIIKPANGFIRFNFKELWQYKDLIYMFVKRNFTTLYKQTILGPLWIIITPLISTVISTFVFGTIAGISSDGLPYFLFYMAGNTAWSYFSTCLNSTASTFTGNAGIFGKVYFPRLVTPISAVITGLLNFSVQLVMLIGFMIFFVLRGNAINPNLWILITPLLVVHMAMLGLGCGIIVSSLTTKYRDLTVLVGFGISLWMYITPIIYPMSELPMKWKTVLLLNPMAPIIEAFRYAFLGSGDISFFHLGISFAVTLVILFAGIMLFSKVEKTFMDTV